MAPQSTHTHTLTFAIFNHPLNICALMNGLSHYVSTKTNAIASAAVLRSAVFEL